MNLDESIDGLRTPSGT